MMFEWFKRKKNKEPENVYELREDLTWEEFFSGWREYKIMSEGKDFFKITEGRYDKYDEEEKKVWKKIK